MMTPEELRMWADEQVAVLMSCGVDALEAQRSVTWVLENCPEGQDPRTWIPSAEQLAEPIDESAIEDARAAWYASDAVPAKYKRLLDATEDTKE